MYKVLLIVYVGDAHYQSISVDRHLNDFKKPQNPNRTVKRHLKHYFRQLDKKCIDITEKRIKMGLNQIVEVEYDIFSEQHQY